MAAITRQHLASIGMMACVFLLLTACAHEAETPADAKARGQAAAGQGTPLSAERFLLLEVSPNGESSANGKAETAQSFAKLFENGQYEKAEEKARRLLKSNPYDQQGMIYLVTALLLEKKYSLASVYASSTQHALANDADFLNLRGVAAYYDNRGPEGLRQAAEAFTAALKVNPKHVAALLNQANLALETSRLDEAKDGFKEARRACKDCYLAILGQGQISLKEGKYKEAIGLLQNALDRRPQDYHIMLLMAQTYFFGLKDKVNAESFANRALEAAPKSDVDLRERLRDLKRQMNGGKVVADEA